jgi:hypothetical protein
VTPVRVNFGANKPCALRQPRHTPPTKDCR